MKSECCNNEKEDPLSSHSLVSAIVRLFVLIIVFKFVGMNKFILRFILEIYM